MANKEQLFIGREHELQYFDNWLHAEHREHIILNVYGLGGIGKSTLLDQFQSSVHLKGGLFYSCDSRDFTHTPQEFTAFLAHLLQVPTHSAFYMDTLRQCIIRLEELSQERIIVLAFDTYESMQALDYWLREAFFSQLPQHVFLIISGRKALQDLWRPYPHWTRIVHPMPLNTFSTTDIQHYARYYNVTEQSKLHKLRLFTQGHPLTLSLLLESYSKERNSSDDRLLSHLKLHLHQIVYQWLEEIKNEKLRRMVEAASIVQYFEQDLLAHMIEAPITPDEFNQFIQLSFIRQTNVGWNVHDIIQENLAKEMRLRVPRRYKAMWQRSISYYYKQLMNSSGEAERSKWMEALFFVLGDSMIRTIFYEEKAGQRFWGEQATESHFAEIEAFLAQLIAGFQQLEVKVEYIDSVEEHTFLHHIPADYFKREASLLISDQLLKLDLQAFHLIRGETGDLAGILVNIPINDSTIDYLRQSSVSASYFSQLSQEELASYSVPAPQRSGYFLRLIGLKNDNDDEARQALMRYMLSLWFKAPRSIVTTAFPFYQALLERIGFRKVPNVVHNHYGPQFSAPTYVLDLRNEHLLHFLEQIIAKSGVSISPLLSEGSFHFTRKELEVAGYVIECLTNNEIAERMNITEITVKKHLSSIFQKANVNSRMELLKKIYEEHYTNV